MEKQLIPQLRFPEFKEKWNNLRLGDLGVFMGGGTPSTNNKDYWVGDIPWISSSDVKEKDILNIEITRYLSTKAVNESATKLIPKNSVLFVSRVGVGKLFVSIVDLCTSQDFANLIPIKDNSYYIAYYFLSRNKLLHQYSQGTSIKGFTTGDLKSIPINIPKASEQQKIASFLTDVDDKITKLTKKKTLLEEYKKGVMQKIFNQELRFKDDNGNTFPEWEEKKLGEVAIKKSSNISANTIEENNGNYKIYGASGLLKKIDFYREKEPYISIVKDGAGVGRTLLCDAYSSVLGTLDIIKPIKDVNLYFVYCLLSNINFLKFITGSTIPHIYFKDYSTVKIKIPVLQEQTKIANFLSDIDLKIEALNTKIENSKAFKKGLLQKMFV
ncbi:restriction endonuclease subunit S [Flavivirga spongiicola]|uniref:Restriction endonuclease subunit S n=1 Tax=Flavivirga spongiicola TaxID=421621 RepID=A0ABU7XPW3_9FLAO|nr:restriction endonuclease subunit S [Flavivirga sp. MEBiC05379]MDO5981561.1 restriction endonuclease subunit S [Flavivirga sp. MEBiC05379]